MSPNAQAKILRAIECREIYRLGSNKRVPVRCRVIAATNQNLELSVLEGRFRKDLYFRLSVTRVELPSLRERIQDLPLLCKHFVSHFNTEFGLRVSGVSDELLSRMEKYEWPGNLRELRNLIEASFVNRPTGTIRIEGVPESFHIRLHEGQFSLERNLVIEALRATNWNQSKAAAKLRYSRMTLYRKLARFKIEPPDRNTPAKILGTYD